MKIFAHTRRDYPEKMERSKILERLRETHSHFDPDAVFAEAKQEKVCPFEVQLELARKADAIVADYNYVFEPGAALRHLGREELGDAILLVDEAHNLPDRARQIFSPELLEETLRAAEGSILLQSGELFESISETIAKPGELLRETARVLASGEAIAEVEPPIRGVAGTVEGMGAEIRPLPFVETRNETGARRRIAILDMHFAWQRFVAILNLFGPGFSCVAERRRSVASPRHCLSGSGARLWRPHFVRLPRPFCFRPRFRRWK